MTKRWMMSLASVMVMVTGCADDPSAQVDEAQTSCRTLARTYADTCARCLGAEAWDACFEEIDRVCPSATSLRDPEALHDACLPWLESVDCEVFLAEDLALSASCVDQVRY